MDDSKHTEIGNSNIAADDKLSLTREQDPFVGYMENIESMASKILEARKNRNTQFPFFDSIVRLEAEVAILKHCMYGF